MVTNVVRLMVASLIAMTAAKVFATSPAPVDASLQTGLAAIKQQTSIPILLPSSLPAPLHDTPMLVSFGDADQDSYDVSLYVGDGNGGTTVLIGEFFANAHPKYARVGRPVHLVNQITGHFLPRSCGGSCAPSSIEWSIKGIQYEIQLKFGFDNELTEEKVMVEAANSAIEGGAR